MPSDTRVFVGRRGELAELSSGLKAARAGRGRLFFVTGEPGIGKTRLTEEVSRQAESSGWVVLRSGAWQGAGTPAYWLFIQIIRAALYQYTRPVVSDLSACIGAGVMRELVQLVPELQPALPLSLETAKASSDPEEARFLLFDAVAMLLRNLTGIAPLMLVLEDLHDADEPSLLMLRFVARHLNDSPVLILGTYRDVELRKSRASCHVISALLHEGAEVPLFALSREDIARMVEARAEAPFSPALIADIYQTTAGNPLFVDGLVRVLAAEGSLNPARRLSLSSFKVPDGVREVIRRWIALLSNRWALTVAAFIGQQFELKCLLSAIRDAADEVPDALREAITIGLLQPLSTGVYRFAHALVRNALTAELSSAENAEVHKQIGEAIEEIYQTDLETRLTELAHHFLQAGNAVKAREYSIRAGEAARAVFAYEQAAEHWRTALELLPDSLETRQRRAELIEALGELASFSGSVDAETRFLQPALRIYEELGDTEAALRVRARMAVNVLGEGMRIGHGLVDSQRAMDIREELGDELMWARAAVAHIYDLWAIGRIEDALALASRVADAADRLNDTVAGAGVSAAYTEMLIWLCDPDAAANSLEFELLKPRMATVPLNREVIGDWLRFFQVLRSGPQEPPVPFAQAHGEPATESQIAFYRGDWEQAELVLLKASDLAGRGGRTRHARVYGAWLARVQLALGKYSAVETSLLENLGRNETNPDVPFELHTRQELALLYGQTGRPEEARPHLARCHEIMAAREDWRGLGAHVGRADAVVAAAEARFDDAQVRFAKSVDTYRRFRLPFEEAETLHYWGRMLTAAGQYGGAIEKFDAATEIYNHHGAGKRWLDRVKAGRLQPQSIKGNERRTNAVELSREPRMSLERELDDSQLHGVMRREGEYWTLEWVRTEFRLKHRKGFEFLVYLLQNAGQEFAAEDLINVIESSFSGEIGLAPELVKRTGLDPTVSGLQGREAKRGEAHIERKAASVNERARLAVTKAIKSAMERIRDADPKLGRHLARSVRTGYFCAYLPEEPTTWRF